MHYKEVYLIVEITKKRKVKKMNHYAVGDIILPNAPIMIGAGVCKSPKITKKWLKVAPVVSGSYTPKRREGNKGNRLFYPDSEEELRTLGFGLNSFGMPNEGIVDVAEDFMNYEGENPLIISIAGFSVDDYIIGVKRFSNVKSVQAIELNFGCPNTEHGKILSFDPCSLDRVFQKLAKFVKLPVWVKFSPYSDPGLLKEVARVINSAVSVVKAVVTCNTFPNAYAGGDVISPMNGLAGLSGPALKPIALGQAVQFKQHLVTEVDIIGVGGITTGNDVIDFLDVGAKAVQCTSLPFWLGNPSKFWEVLLNQETGNRLETYLNN